MTGVERLRRSFLPWLVAGVVAWAGVAWIGWTLWNQDPPRVGFDLALLLDGARAVGDGQSPYDPTMLAGGSPSATELFYSYPPPVAQAMQLVTWLPNGVVLVVWAIGATLGLGHIAGEIARRDRQGEPRSTLIGAKAILTAPLFLPFAVAILFGNLDAWYPLLYGALVLAAFPTSGRWTWLAAGAAVALVAIAKLHPAVLGLWLLVRVVADRDGPWRTVLLAAVVTGLAILGASVVFGGVQPWLDYVAVIRAGAGAELVDPRNLGPVSLLGQATGLDAQALRVAQVVVTLTAAVVTVLAAWRVRDPIASLAFAFTASLVVLPVTWYHYPVALIPIGLALAITRPATRPWVAVAIILAAVALTFGPMLWVAIAVLIVAALRSGSAATVTVDGPVVPVTGPQVAPRLPAMPQRTLTIVLPAYNEEARLAPALDELFGYLHRRGSDGRDGRPGAAQLPPRVTVLVVDDGSTDSTAAIVCDRPEVADGELQLLTVPHGGKGSAVRAGMLHADGDYLIFADADMATPPDELPLLMDALDAADAAYGSRIQPDGSDMRASQPGWRRLLGRTFHLLASLWVVGPVQDTQCGFKGFRRDVARDVFARQRVTSIVFDVELIYLVRRRGYSHAVVPIRWSDRRGSRMHPGARLALRVAWDLVRIPVLHRAVRPARRDSPDRAAA